MSQIDETFRKRRQNTNMSQKDGADDMDGGDKIDNMGGNGENEDGEIMDDNTGNDDTSQYTGNAPISDNIKGGQTYIAKALKNQLVNGKKAGVDDEEEDEVNKVKYIQRAVASNRYIEFQANATEINFDLIHLRAGYFLRLEMSNLASQGLSYNAGGTSGNVNTKQVQKHIMQQAFQFSYDPIFKRFNRELRDTENKNHIMDKFYLDLKQKKEQSKLEGSQAADPNIHRYAAMSYISFLNRQQRMIERGADIDDFEEDEENSQSEDQSEDSQSKSINEEGRKSKTIGKLTDMNGGKSLAQLAQTQQQQQQQFQSDGFSKLLVAAEGYGKEFLKSEIERLIRILQEKQSVGDSVHTYVRSENSRKGWEEDNTQKAGLFGDRGGDIDKVDNEDEHEEERAKETNEKSNENDSLKANIKSKKAFSMAINDKNMPPAIKKLSTTA